jgi:hypothetical protein
MLRELACHGLIVLATNLAAAALTVYLSLLVASLHTTEAWFLYLQNLARMQFA